MFFLAVFAYKLINYELQLRKSKLALESFLIKKTRTIFFDSRFPSNDKCQLAIIFIH